MAEFPSMPFWTDAYLADTKHLTCTEHGAYFLLLVCAWRMKSHMLPDDDKFLAKYCGLSAGQWRRIRPRIQPFFEVEGGYLISKRLLDEVDFVRRQVGQRSNAGKASALKRLHRGSTVVQRNLNETATPTPTPTYKKANGDFERGKKEEIDKKAKIWISRDSEQWRAWDMHYRKLKGVGPPKMISNNEEGFWFDSEFPQ